MSDETKMPGCPICFSPDGKHEFKPPRSVLKLIRHVYAAHQLYIPNSFSSTFTPENVPNIILEAWMEKAFGKPLLPPQSGYYTAEVIAARKERTRQGLFAIRLDFALPTYSIISERFVLGRRKDPDGDSSIGRRLSQGFTKFNQILRQHRTATIRDLMENPELIVGCKFAIFLRVEHKDNQIKTKLFF